MITETFFQAHLERIIQTSIAEDVGDGDHSSLACIPKSALGSAQLLVKDNGVLAGVGFATMIFKYVDSDLKIEVLMNDGDSMQFGDIAFKVYGRSLSILKAERLVLNSMQRMSAIATKTASFVKLLEGTKTKILDTRKTTPGIRAIEKWAVTIGGGENHRFGLFDMVMLKDNHIDFAGGIKKAIEKTKNYLVNHQLNLNIIVEARNLQEVEEILEAGGVYRILLDNFNFEQIRQAVKMIGNQCLTEASGGINEHTLRDYALCGVDYISSGALTHSVSNLDLSLKAM